jgi:hypothetical protein
MVPCNGSTRSWVLGLRQILGNEDEDGSEELPHSIKPS